MNAPFAMQWKMFLLFIIHLPDVEKAEFTISPNDINFDSEHYFDNYINNTESVFWTEKSLIDALEKILLKNQF